MKNLTLITLNNTLHIKADNLEPIEVYDSCDSELCLSVGFNFLNSVEKNEYIFRKLKKGIKLPQ